MNRAIMIDAVPRNINGETIYVETDFYTRDPRGLGVTQTQVVTTATNVANLTNAVSSAIPPQKVSVQSDFSKTTNVVATGAATVAAVAALVPGIGTVVAVVAGVVATAAALLGKIFANSKAKAYAAERGEYEKVNSQIRYEINELDKQFDVTFPAVEQLKSAISSLNGLGGSSSSLGALGICWGDCKEEKARLASAKAEYDVLQKELTNKTTLMASLLDEYNKLIREIVNLKSDKSTRDWLAIILLGSAIAAVAYFAFKKSK